MFENLLLLLFSTLLISNAANGHLLDGYGYDETTELVEAGHRSLSASYSDDIYDLAQGEGSCLDPANEGNYRCPPGQDDIKFLYCELTDADWDAIGACLDNAGRAGIESLWLAESNLTYVPEDAFQGLGAVQVLRLDNNQIGELEPTVFDGLPLEFLSLFSNSLTALPEGIFDDLGSTLSFLDVSDNSLKALPPGIFGGANILETLSLRGNDLTTLPAGLFDGLGTDQLYSLSLEDNPGLQCIPAIESELSPLFSLPDVTGMCECTPAEAVMCAEATTCVPGQFGYTCSGSSLSTCTDGTPGIDGSNDNGDVCCPAGCMQCGGAGCATAGAEQGLDNTACCINGVLNSDVYCGNGVEAPCIVGSDDTGSTCVNGIPGIDGSNDNGDVCCPVGCTQCGGAGCAQAGAAQGLDNTACCINGVLNSNIYCGNGMEAPCIVGSDDSGPKCINGTPGIDGSNDNGDVCCPIGCTQCGGAGCARAGAAQGLDNTACCINGVLNSGIFCGGSVEAPCIV